MSKLKASEGVDEVFTYDYEVYDEDTVLCDELIAPVLFYWIGWLLVITGCIFGCVACCARGNNDGNSHITTTNNVTDTTGKNAAAQPIIQP